MSRETHTIQLGDRVCLRNPKPGSNYAWMIVDIEGLHEPRVVTLAVACPTINQDGKIGPRRVIEQLALSTQVERVR